MRKGEMNMKDMIKQALMEGMSLDAILDTVEKAREEVENENALDLDACREDLVCVVLDYLRALGIVPSTMVFSDKDIQTAIKAVKDAEGEIKEQAAALKMLMPILKTKAKPKVKKVDADTAIQNWLDTL